MAAPTFVADSGPQGSWRAGGQNGKKFLYVAGILTVDGTVGAAVGDIPAATFGLYNIFECSPLVDSTNSYLQQVVPDYTRSSLLCLDPGADTLLDLPAGSYRLVVYGQSNGIPVNV